MHACIAGYHMHAEFIESRRTCKTPWSWESRMVVSTAWVLVLHKHGKCFSCRFIPSLTSF